MRISFVAFTFCFSTWIALAGSSACMPLGDLDSASAEYDSDDGADADDSSSLGGGAGQGGGCGADALSAACLPTTQEGCGDGIKQVGEACDDAGLSERCNASCQSTSCVAGCYCFSEHGSSYMLCPQPWSSWLDSEAVCEEAGMQLASIADARENTFLGYRTFKGHASDTWVGATDAANEGDWRWMNQESFWVGDNAGEATGDAFTAWNLAVGEPNNSVDDSENCMRLAPRALWHDELCSQARAFLCEARWPSSSTCNDGELGAGEVCDTRGFSASCDDDCTVPRCGDGVLNEPAGEVCDDGNNDTLDACSNDCQPTGLVGYWPLLERTDEWAADLSDTAASAALSNCSFGNQLGLSFNDGVTDEASSDDYLQIPERAALAFTGPYTLSLHALPTAAPGGAQTLLFRKGAGDEKLFLRLSGSNLQGGSIVTSSTDEYLVQGDVSASFGVGTWSHFALTYDGTVYRLYANGSEIAFEDVRVRAPVAAEMGWRIGNEPGSNAFAFHGRLANVRIYTRALSEDELKVLFAVIP